MPLDEAIDVGNTYRWQLGGIVEILNMFIDEDGETQVRVNDRDNKRTIDSETLFDLVEGGALIAANGIDWEEPGAYATS